MCITGENERLDFRPWRGGGWLDGSPAFLIPLGGLGPSLDFLLSCLSHLCLSPHKYADHWIPGPVGGWMSFFEREICFEQVGAVIYLFPTPRPKGTRSFIWVFQLSESFHTASTAMGPDWLSPLRILCSRGQHCYPPFFIFDLVSEKAQWLTEASWSLASANAAECECATPTNFSFLSESCFFFPLVLLLLMHQSSKTSFEDPCFP